MSRPVTFVLLCILSVSAVAPSLSTPERVQQLQTALPDKAKESPSFRFYARYDKVKLKLKLKLTVNATKTRVCKLPEEKFDIGFADWAETEVVRTYQERSRDPCGKDGWRDIPLALVFARRSVLHLGLANSLFVELS